MDDRYVAFLRGINVGGHALIKMEDLRKLFVSLGLNNVKTYIQSGNVVFESAESEKIITQKIERGIKTKFKQDITVFIRTMPDIEKIIAKNPFKKLPSEAKPYVTFISEAVKLKLPLFSANKDVEVFRMINNNLFSFSHKVKGKRGFPNTFIEKQLKIKATTRNWETVKKILEL